MGYSYSRAVGWSNSKSSETQQAMKYLMHGITFHRLKSCEKETGKKSASENSLNIGNEFKWLVV